MKRILNAILLLGLGLAAEAQQYSFTFRLGDEAKDTVLYAMRHFRDQLQPMDTARRADGGVYVFKGRKAWQTGLYALVKQDGKTQLGDFAVDGSLRFSITADARLTPQSVKVKGCEANRLMFDYLATEAAAISESAAIRERKKGGDSQAEADEKALNERMLAYEATARHPKRKTYFFDMVNAFDRPEVPDTVQDKPVYYRRHYWDSFWQSGESFGRVKYSPQLFNWMNYFFFGLMYYADSDTICAEIDRMAARIAGDTAMLRYVFDFIEPRYFRSTRNVGWDAVWCHLASEYYLKGRCPWATEGTLHNMRYNYNRIRQSLIGAHGQELLMMDTTQIDAPEHWYSSHQFAEPYVILWFWDPDCHHCQEQSEQLKQLYDNMVAAGKKRFEVYAIGYEADVDKWRRYVREHDFRWVNVGGTNVNIDYQEAYNVHGAPTMIILNERRDIIMNKVLPVKSLMQFFDEYEKRTAK